MKFLSMGKVVLRSLFGKPSTYGYPFTPREYPDTLRGAIGIDIDACIFCGLCARKCPTDAIEVNRQEKSWTIKRMQCVYCSYCVDTCMKNCLWTEHTHVVPDTVKQVDTYKQEPPEAEEEAAEEQLETPASTEASLGQTDSESAGQAETPEPQEGEPADA
ncbi:MAG: 4Fe-4S binding protein [Clostridiales Family XIII bacterium]|jgi:formate hydrogenlyase subunit 6/NADH:ubiquinone oxidoreductase subunit I|nr:4Fe-4S binding protein [Clostridiales Family XIII bacterium]